MSHASGRRERMRLLLKDINAEIREHKSSFVVYVVLRVLVIVMMVLQFFNGNFENVFLCLLTLVLLIVPSFIQVTFKIEFPSVLEIIMLTFVFSAEILGEISAFYVLFPFWDIVLHTLNGFLAAAIGFSLVDLLNRSEKTKFHLSPMYLAMVSFCFSMTIGVFWEFFEFAVDSLLPYDMQKDTIVHQIHSVALDPTNTNTTVMIDGIHQTSVNGQDLGIDGYLDLGLHDTMADLFVNFIGAAAFSLFGFAYVKNRGKRSWLSTLIPHRKSVKNMWDVNETSEDLTEENEDDSKQDSNDSIPAISNDDETGTHALNPSDTSDINSSKP